MVVAYYAFRLICNILIYSLIIQAILSWFVGPMMAQGRPNFITKIFFFLNKVNEPLVRPARKFMSRFNTGMLDLSVFVTIIFIILVERLGSTLFRMIIMG